MSAPFPASVLSRRELLAVASSGALAAVALSAVGCATSRRKGVAPSEGASARLPGDLGPREAELLRLAALAPSSHNVQPWRVRIDAPDRWRVGLDPERRLPVVDPDGREMILSVGCFLENLVVAAGAAGITATVAPAADAGSLAEVRLAPGRTGGSTTALERRRTVRNGHGPAPLGAAEIDRLLALAGEGARWCPRGTPEARAIEEASVEAFRQQTWNDRAQAELAGWIHFGGAEAEARADGLTPASMELGAFARLYARTFFDRDTVLARSFRERGIDGAARQAQEGAGWLVIPGTDRTAPALLDAGRRAERVFLAATEADLGVHPMTQAIEEAPFRDQLPAALDLDRAPEFLLRIGRLSRRLEPVTLRRPVEAFVSGPGEEWIRRG